VYSKLPQFDIKELNGVIAEGIPQDDEFPIDKEVQTERFDSEV
jgi:hypothetical protein